MHRFSKMPNEVKKTKERSACQLHPRCSSSTARGGSRCCLQGIWGDSRYQRSDWAAAAPSRSPGLRCRGSSRHKTRPQSHLQFRSQRSSSSPARLNGRDKHCSGGCRESQNPSQLINSPLTDQLPEIRGTLEMAQMQCLYSLLCLSLPSKNGWIRIKLSLQNRVTCVVGYAASGRKDKT